MTDNDDLDRLRGLLRRMLGHDEPEPEHGNVVAAEGRTTGTPAISPDQRARDFVNRVAGRIPAHAEHLPEDN